MVIVRLGVVYVAQDARLMLLLTFFPVRQVSSHVALTLGVRHRPVLVSCRSVHRTYLHFNQSFHIVIFVSSFCSPCVARGTMRPRKYPRWRS